MNESNDQARQAAPGARLLLTLGEDLEGARVSLDAWREDLAEEAPGGPAIRLARGRGAVRGAISFSPDGGKARTFGPEQGPGARPVVFMFPGLGDHYVGMGRGLYEREPVFRAAVDECAELLHPELGEDLRERLYPAGVAAPKRLDLRALLGRGAAPQASRSGDAEGGLDRTRLAQPAMFVVEYALAQLWMSWGLRPSLMIGYSLGEYVAACIAGVLPLDAMLRLVARRAQLIDELPAGAMLAVTAPAQQLRGSLSSELSISAISGPELCVLAGSPAAVEAFAADCEARGLEHRRISTSHAFHSTMMEPIGPAVTELAQGLELAAPRIPYVSNVTGALITDEQARDPSYWTQHLCRPVLAQAGLEVVLADADAILLELGPGQTLSSLAMGLAAGQGSERSVVASMRHALAPDDDLAFAHRALARAWIAGAAIDDASLPEAGAPARARGDAPTVALGLVVAPQGETEQALAGLWSELLSCAVEDRTSNFFELGGNSLIATRVSYRVGRRFGVKVSLREIYELQSLAELAARIEALQGGSAGAGAQAEQGEGSKAAPRTRLPNGVEISHQNPGETRHFYSDIFEHRSYLRHGVDLPQGATVFDVGANIGLFTLFTHLEGKGAQIYSFEPAPPMFEILSRNVAEHGVNARVFNFGLSDAERDAEFTFYPRSSGMSSFHADEQDERHVLTTIIENQRAGGETLDELREHADDLLEVRLEAQTMRARLRRLSDVIREEEIDRIDLLKIDVQRCEHEVIAGIDEGDWPKIEQVALEVHDIDGRVAELEQLFEARGFAVTTIQDELYRGTDIHNIYALRS